MNNIKSKALTFIASFIIGVAIVSGILVKLQPSIVTDTNGKLKYDKVAIISAVAGVAIAILISWLLILLNKYLK